ncbi:PA5502 family lipoprotein [Pseudomonas tohonis]|uniref:PA5502 family lipoprotein n=1 Tax=Pseudomonas tohonis TaxID=2725477 RepID=UPI001F43A248|nr:PA5502 family lipoprotein [Pseudomonas tohonis]
MMLFATRYLPVIAISLLLAACQSKPQVASLPTDDLVTSFRQLDLSLNNGQLADAETQLKDLQQRAAGDTRLEQYQRQLTEAWLKKGQAALQQGDLDTATTALSHARSLMPQAPALTTGLDGAIAQARASELDRAEQARTATEQAAAKEVAARTEQARQQRLALERQAAEAAKLVAIPAPVAQPAAAAKPVRRVANQVALPMLDNDDNERLRSLLDAVAADVVAFDCGVRLQVREAKQYPWVVALLSARVKKLDPSYKLRVDHSIDPAKVPNLVLSPKS